MVIELRNLHITWRIEFLSNYCWLLAFLSSLETMVSEDSASISRFWTSDWFKRLIDCAGTSSETLFPVFAEATGLQCSSSLSNCIKFVFDATSLNDQITVFNNSPVYKWRRIQTFTFFYAYAFLLIFLMLIRIILIQKRLKLPCRILLFSRTQVLFVVICWVSQETFFINWPLNFLKLSYFRMYASNPNFVIAGGFFCVGFIDITAKFDAFVEYCLELCLF